MHVIAVDDMTRKTYNKPHTLPAPLMISQKASLCARRILHTVYDIISLDGVWKSNPFKENTALAIEASEDWQLSQSKQLRLL